MKLTRDPDVPRVWIQFRLASLFWLASISAVLVFFWPTIRQAFSPKWQPSTLIGIDDSPAPRDYDLHQEAMEIQQAWQRKQAGTTND